MTKYVYCLFHHYGTDYHADFVYYGDSYWLIPGTWDEVER